MNNSKKIILLVLTCLIFIAGSLPAVAGLKSFTTNDKVKIWWREKWELATVLEAGEGRYKVHFLENDMLIDKWVPEKIVHNYTYKNGDIIMVKNKQGRWVTGRVIAAGSLKYKVHLLNTESTSDYWVGPYEIKDISYADGERVQVLWMGDWYEARILKYSDGQYLVHYEGFSETNDQWVTLDRIKKWGTK